MEIIGRILVEQPLNVRSSKPNQFHRSTFGSDKQAKRLQKYCIPNVSRNLSTGKLRNLFTFFSVFIIFPSIGPKTAQSTFKLDLV